MLKTRPSRLLVAGMMVVLLLTLGFVLAACGGDEEETTTTTAAAAESTTTTAATTSTSEAAETTTTAAAPADEEFVFGMLLVGPYNDHGWSQAHYEGGKYVEAKLPGAKMIYIDKVNPADRPGTTPEQLAEDWSPRARR